MQDAEHKALAAAKGAAEAAIVCRFESRQCAYAPCFVPIGTVASIAGGGTLTLAGITTGEEPRVNDVAKIGSQIKVISAATSTTIGITPNVWSPVPSIGATVLLKRRYCVTATSGASQEEANNVAFDLSVNAGLSWCQYGVDPELSPIGHWWL